MKSEIGGYLELDEFSRPILHGEMIALNSGRSCLEYLIRLRDVRRIWIPDYLCRSISDVCEKCGVDYLIYSITEKMVPRYDFDRRKGDWLYLVDYFGQLSSNDIVDALSRFDGKVILDEAQSYYRPPHDHVDVIYTCRKWFGVPDGAFLNTSDGAVLSQSIPAGRSAEHMEHVLGRFEGSAGDYYELAKQNNRRFAHEGLTEMSRLTRNLLQGVDYDQFEVRRFENWHYLDDALGGVNLMSQKCKYAPFMYLLMLPDDSARFRKKLAGRGIYVPALWPNVIDSSNAGGYARKYATQSILLPVDQRYGKEEMRHVVNSVQEVLEEL